MRVRIQNTMSVPMAAPSHAAWIPPEYATAITMIAPMSSITATPSRNAHSDEGTRVRRAASTARANATSVAMGMPHPCWAGPPAVKAR